MNRLRWLAILMGITILGITGFQLYWLKQNYDREGKTLSIKANMNFRESVLHLQVVKLKLNVATSDSTGHGSVKIFMKGRDGMRVRTEPREDIISTINIIRDKMSDSVKKKMQGNTMIISMNKETMNMTPDSVQFISQHVTDNDPEHNKFLSLLYNVDSLQDTIHLSEVDSAYGVSMKKDNLNVPYKVVKLDSAANEDEPAFDQVTVGFARPVTYQVQLGNTFPYLIRRIIQPILFSILLLGITILSFVLLYRNIIKQRRLGEQKNEFISNITHELKTPIATVGVAIEALKNFNAIQNPERTREYLDISSNELQRLSLLVDKVLRLSMFEKKEVELKYENFDLETLVQEVVTSLRLQFEKQHAQVTITKKGDTYLSADRLHLMSVIFNLLDNALKYSRETPSIQVAIREQEKNIVMQVTDQGIGIAPEYKTKVFEKFFRVPHGDTHDAKGYGLGLSYAAQVIEKHQGTIQVESQPGIGTTFTITLPKQPV